MPFKYAKVLIVGATSGIGQAMAEKLLSAGSKVIVTGRRAENLAKFASLHDPEGSGRVSTVVSDVTDFAAIPKFANDIVSAHPDLDCVFFNSGIMRGQSWAELDTIDLDSMESEFAVNYFSTLHLTKAFLPFLTKQAPKEVAIIYITSGLALLPITSSPNYCASKAALHHMVLAMRLQLQDAKSNVKIIELLPPLVQTELHSEKNQPQLKGKTVGGMPLNDFIEEAYAGLNSGSEQVPVQLVKTRFGFDSWEQERQKAMHGLHEFRKQMEANSK